MVKEYIDIMIDVKENDLEHLKRELEILKNDSLENRYHDGYMKGWLSGRIMEVEFVLRTLNHLKNGKQRDNI